MALCACIDEYLIVSAKRHLYCLDTQNNTSDDKFVPTIGSSVNIEKILGKNVEGHIETLDTCAENKLIALTTSERSLFLYRFHTHGPLCPRFALVRHVPLAQAATKIRFTPDGMQILISDRDGNCYTHNYETDADVKQILANGSMVLDIMLTIDSR